MAALLELTGVSAGYGPTAVLHGISLSVEEGEIVEAGEIGFLTAEESAVEGLLGSDG